MAGRGLLVALHLIEPFGVGQFAIETGLMAGDIGIDKQCRSLAQAETAHLLDKAADGAVGEIPGLRAMEERPALAAAGVRCVDRQLAVEGIVEEKVHRVDRCQKISEISHR
jgi:hypothetical protein